MSLLVLDILPLYLLVCQIYNYANSTLGGQAEVQNVVKCYQEY